MRRWVSRLALGRGVCVPCVCGTESLVRMTRNPLPEVARFFEAKHQGRPSAPPLPQPPPSSSIACLTPLRWRWAGSVPEAVDLTHLLSVALFGPLRLHLPPAHRLLPHLQPLHRAVRLLPAGCLCEWLSAALPVPRSQPAATRDAAPLRTVSAGLAARGARERGGDPLQGRQGPDRGDGRRGAACARPGPRPGVRECLRVQHY